MPTTWYLVLAAALFGLGLIGILTRRSLIHVLFSIELLFNAVALNFIAFAWDHGDLSGQVFALFVIAVAAGEAAVGLAILIALHRLRQSVDLGPVTELSG
ncbi:MAG: NADH-quinone oxidoreductase subunit NuoK [Thermoanaerobaculia bacterium]